ncbi:hypothetical protein AMK26_21385 [Streptomyces sp. CB03234]|uniref:hypothetical protein n=1 Tax=Streptomyces sp. (strain CB03234) TaxID=1703937 RepID=UPI00093D7DA9|nr:hypothetical protein [Streptomyces sp. CB03234]OKK02242.1 hypothetical protein AMK26_21385 [Streptomyces sp. CB03234]
MSAALVGAAVVGASVLGSAPASALNWKCTSSSSTIDDAGYSGPWGDNWDFTVKNCVARSGGYVYAKATVSWDAPPWYSGTDLSETFDSAHFRLYLNHSDAGPDTVLLRKDFNIQPALAAMNGSGSGNGSWTSSTIKKSVGSKSAYADGALRLNWDEDGKGVRQYDFKGTGSV